ncbi:MoaD/ThiS family protein [bacterium]|nr:MoaD/ThiS family protein [bacterium]
MTPPRTPVVSLELPSTLGPVAGWRRLEVTGRTIGEALEVAFEKTPVLRHHLIDAGQLRPHILCILNDAVLPRGKQLAAPVNDGDEILIHQAISGG